MAWLLQDSDFIQQAQNDPTLAEKLLPEAQKIIGQIIGSKFQYLLDSGHFRGDIGDLFQVGYEAFYQVLKRFDPSLGIAFTSYAVPWIEGKIRSYIGKNSHVAYLPRPVRDNRYKVKCATDKIRSELGQDPEIGAIVKVSGLSRAEVEEALSSFSPELSLSSMVAYDPEEGSQVDLESIAGVDDEWVDQVIEAVDLRKVFEKLPKECKLIAWYRYHGLDQKSIGTKLGISQAHVSRLQRRLYCRLREEASQELQELTKQVV